MNTDYGYSYDEMLDGQTLSELLDELEYDFEGLDDIELTDDEKAELEGEEELNIDLYNTGR